MSDPLGSRLRHYLSQGAAESYFAVAPIRAGGDSDLEDRRAPGEAAAEHRREDGVALLDLALLAPVVDGERDGGGGGVAVELDGVEHLVGRDLGERGDLLVDAQVGLVGDEPVDVVPR